MRGQRLWGIGSKWGGGHSPEGMACWLRHTHMSELLDLSMVSNGDLLSGLAIPGPKLLRGFHNAPALSSPKTQACHPTTQAWQRRRKKLGTICVGSSIFHSQDTRTWMKLPSFYFSPKMDLAPVPTVCEVTTLAEKSGKIL